MTKRIPRELIRDLEWEPGKELPKREPRIAAPASSSSEYPTPSASRYGRNKGGQNPNGPERPSLDTWAKSWGTPTSRDYKNAETLAKSKGGRDLSKEAAQWPTPGTDSFRSRGGDGKDEKGLGQLSTQWPTATTGDSRQSGGRNETAAKERCATHPSTSLTDASRLFPQVPTTGEGGSAFSTLADRISSLGLSKRLNPRFQLWLMGWLRPAELMCCDSEATESSRSNPPSQYVT